MTRWKASGIHLSISLMIGITAFCLLYFVYYPQPYFAPAGASKLVVILLGVDVILGPLLTLVVFKSGKKSLKFDLSTIALVQMAALTYGLHVMWVARPVFIVAVVDRVEIVYANTLTQPDLAAAEFEQYRALPKFGPVLVGVRKTRGVEALELVESAVNGRDIQFYPKFYAPWSKAVVKELLTHSYRKKSGTGENPRIKILRRQYPYMDFIPMRGRTEEYALIFNSKLGVIVTGVEVNLW